MRAGRCAAVAIALIATAPAPAVAGERSMAPSRASGSVTAQIVAATGARARPGAGRRVWRAGILTTWSRRPQRLLVVGRAERHGREWIKVLLPIRPNGTAGWVPRDKVLLGRTRYWIRLRLVTRRMTVYRKGRPVRRFRAVIGAPGTPTPAGLHAIYERNRQPNPRGFLGPWSLSLTALSDVLESFGGGPGRVAIHGRAGASLRDPLGSARSHGCVRIASRAVTWLSRHARPGTPVEIR